MDLSKLSVEQLKALQAIVASQHDSKARLDAITTGNQLDASSSDTGNSNTHNQLEGSNRLVEGERGTALPAAAPAPARQQSETPLPIIDATALPALPAKQSIPFRNTI